MKKLNELSQAILDAEQTLDDAKDARNDYLRPIVQAYTGQVPRGNWSAIYVERGIVHLELEWFTSGGRYTSDYKIPADVFNASDECDAAKQARAIAEKESEDKRESELKAQIAYLQSQLKS